MDSLKVLLAIDVGIKNLAMCIMSCEDKKDLKTYKIHYWNNCNVLDETKLCPETMKNGNVCGKKCSMRSGRDSYTCKTHADACAKKYTPKKVQAYLLQDIVERVVRKLKEIIGENTELFKSLK